MASSADDNSNLTKIALYIRRKAGMSYEDFHEYWSKKHAPIFLGIGIVQKNVLKYTQFHINAPFMTELDQLGLPLFSGFDGVVECVGKDLDSLLAILDDPEYLEKVVPDELNFVDKEASRMVVGHDEVKLNRF